MNAKLTMQAHWRRTKEVYRETEVNRRWKFYLWWTGIFFIMVCCTSFCENLY